MKYGPDLGCKYGAPHDLAIIFENTRLKVEQCGICSCKYRWNKRSKGRVDNVAYLKAHVRNFAQKFGATRRVYYKTYFREKTKIII